MLRLETSVCRSGVILGLSLLLHFDPVLAQSDFSISKAPDVSPDLLGGVVGLPVVVPEAGIPAGLILENLELPFLFWVELGAGKLHLLERIQKGNYVKRQSVPISIGKHGFGKKLEGDRKTPIGVYQITSFIEDEQLDDSYGIGAYPLNYPNIWDRLSKRTGHGIWLHGLPKGTDQRPLQDSDGCVTIKNSTLVQFAANIKTGASLVVLSEKLDWLPPGTDQTSADILVAFDRWKADWEANDTAAYLDHYHEEFTDTRRNLQGWKTYKTRINKAKSFIKVEFSELSVVVYPGEENLVAIRFYQDYKSSNYAWRGWKHLLWRRDVSGSWRILYEGNG